MVAASETTLQELLEGSKQYLVPLYQRTYSWQKRQLSRLFDDIEQLANDRETNLMASHFIGSLVLAATPNIGPVGVQQYLVVDGQQRLTTLSVLLCAIRDHRAETESGEHFEAVTNQFLVNQYKPHHRLKLVPTQADRPSYVACVESSPNVGGADLLGSAYSYFRARLSAADDPDDPTDIEQIQAAVLGGLAIVSVTAQPGDNAHRIFESLNNTGLRLTQGDLIRNYLFMRLPTRGEPVYNSLWLPLQQTLSSDQLEMLFWLDLAQSNPRVKQTDIYSLHQSRLDAMQSEQDIENEIRRIAGLGQLLGHILRPDEEQNGSIRLRLQRLKDWESTTVNALLLHLMDRRKQGTATEAQVARAMLYLESFLVRRLIIGRATVGLNRILMSAVTEMNSDLPVDEAVASYLSTGRKYFATDAEVKTATGLVPFYLNGRPRQRPLVLRWLEESYGNNEPVDLSNSTIEHVLPQTPTPAWSTAFAENLTEDENAAECYDAVLHTIGNLTLSGYNTSLSNRPFAEKREILRSSGIQMNQEIARQDSWGRPEILQRARKLAQTICDTWPGPTAVTETPAGSNWMLMNQVLAELPAGSWTSYGNLAALIGSHPVAIGSRLNSVPTPNAHRVLQVSGHIADNFAWPDRDRYDNPRSLLEKEGVQFTHDRAEPSQMMSTEELGQLVSIEADEIPASVPDLPEVGQLSERERFISQLSNAQQPATARAVLDMLSRWTGLGGSLVYGTADETSCFPLTAMASLPPTETRSSIWPLAVYPVSGTCEVVFQHLASRPPFDQIALRDELRVRLNGIAGIAIAESKLSLRPSFSLSVLSADGAVGQLSDALAWFHQVVSVHLRVDSGPGPA